MLARWLFAHHHHHQRHHYGRHQRNHDNNVQWAADHVSEHAELGAFGSSAVTTVLFFIAALWHFGTTRERASIG
jgi:hypothetical protein